MNLVFEKIVLRTGDFRLEIDLTLTRRATGLFGRSGAGKTSLLELVAGLRRPTGGRVVLGGRVLTDTSARRHLPPEERAVGYVPQDGALFPHLSVEANLCYAARGKRPTAFDQVCATLDLAPLLSRRTTHLSGGERQRVALGRALLSSPRLLLLDEPLASLDADHKAAILPYLHRVRDEFAVPLLYVSHAPNEIIALCEDVLVLEAGRLLTRGTPESVFEKTDTPSWRLKA